MCALFPYQYTQNKDNNELVLTLLFGQKHSLMWTKEKTASQVFINTQVKICLEQLSLIEVA